MLHVFYAAITIISMLFAINLCFSIAILMKFLDSAEPQWLYKVLLYSTFIALIWFVCLIAILTQIHR